MKINLKRIYNDKEETDGFRILVDRIYPRGIKKENLQIDCWDKEIAPSNEIRKTFHTTDNFKTFEENYRQELLQNTHTSDFLAMIKEKCIVTLLTASKEVNHCHLPILKTFIEEQLGKEA